MIESMATLSSKYRLLLLQSFDVHGYAAAKKRTLGFQNMIEKSKSTCYYSQGFYNRMT